MRLPGDSADQSQQSGELDPPQEFSTLTDLAEELPQYKAVRVVLELTGWWNEPADPLGNAVRMLQEQIDVLKQELTAVNARLNKLAERLAQLENFNRLEAFKEVRDNLDKVALALAERPSDSYVRYELAREAGVIADEFLPGPDGAVPDLWKWTDTVIRVPRDAQGNPLPPVYELVRADFKPLVALPLYVLSVMSWLAAVDLATGGNYEEVRNRYGRQIRRHIEGLSPRRDWSEQLHPPRTLPEHIQARITCYPVPRTKYAQNGECRFTITCSNVMERSITAVGDDIVVSMAHPDSLCTYPPDIGTHEEQAVEADKGVAALSALATALRRVERTGTLREQTVSFGSTYPYNLLYLYTVDADGNLEWRKQSPSNRADQPGEWEGPQHVHDGWGDFVAIIPAGGPRFYALQSDGQLLWYQHDGFRDGGARWTGALPVGSSWNFEKIVAGSDGVLYAVKANGELLWYRHAGYKDGRWEWAGPVTVDTGWDGFEEIFSVGDGVIYGVESNGTLNWYRHTGFKTGAPTWEAAVDEVGTGWQEFSSIFTVGFDGIIYAIQPDGTLLWYRHEAWKYGAWPYPSPEWPPSWRGPVTFGSGLTGFRHLFAYMSDTPSLPA
jgi:Tachylectin